MHIEDATAFIVDFIARPRTAADYSDYGYDVYMPNVVAAYLADVEKIPQHLVRDHPRGRELTPFFFDAAWELCRRGALRPGVPNSGNADNKGFSVTNLGRSWIASGALAPIVLDITRLSELFASLSGRLGAGFLQRANEAARCHSFGANLAARALKTYLAPQGRKRTIDRIIHGARAGVIVLAVAIAKTGDEAVALKTYFAAHGRKRRSTASYMVRARASRTPLRPELTAILLAGRGSTRHRIGDFRD
jgi:hypothetical protein